MTELPELIVHIGAGKTGTTSIQLTLKNNIIALSAARTAYLGGWLEHVPGVSSYAWFSPERPAAFFTAGPRDAVEDQIVDVLFTELKRQAEKGVQTVVWSNEAFLVQKVRPLRILRRLAKMGVPIRPVLYVRRHDKRAISAFMEFEIKSKNHEGALQDYGTWLEDSADKLCYARHVDPWMTSFPQIEIFNFDEIDDVAQHFGQTVLGLEGVVSKRANEASPPALLTAWTVYSGSRSSQTWAREFYRLAAPMLTHNGPLNLVPKPQELMPDEADIGATQARFEEDLQEINALLEDRGQPPMNFGPVTPPDVGASDWEIQQMLFCMVFSLQEQVLALKRELASKRGT